MMANDVDTELEKQVRRRIEKRLDARREVLVHLTAFVMVNAGLWVGSDALGITYLLPLIVTLGWTIGLFAHILEYWGEHGPGRVQREALIQREIEKERARLYGDKLKNDLVGIDDEGEIVYYEDDETASQQH